MRILVISDVSGFMVGGVPVEGRKLVDGLVALGHSVGWCNDRPHANPAAAFYPISIDSRASFGREVQEAIDGFRPDVVHVLAMGVGGLRTLVPLLSGRPWLLTCNSIPPYERKIHGLHGSETLHYAARAVRFAANTLAWRWLFTSGRVPLVIVHSEFVRRIVDRYGQKARRIVQVPFGFDPPAAREFGRPQAQGPRILTIAGVAHTKGQHDMVRAMRGIVDRHPSATYVMLGEVRDESYRQHLNDLIATLGLVDNVQVLGSVSKERLVEELQAATVYVQPSHEEGFCLAFIEAAGVVPKLVGTDVGAIRAICGDDPAALVVEPRSPARLEAAVDRLIGMLMDEEAVLASRRRRLTDEFSWDAFAAWHVPVYETVMAGGPH